MENNRRTFIKNMGQLTLATGLTSWWMSCGELQSDENFSKEPFLQVAKIFKDNMVLQRDEPIPIWGWSNQKRMIHVFFNKKKYVTRVTSKSGFWKIILPKMPSGGPFEIKIKQDTHVINISNILIGDVFLCSGQSNIEWPMSRVEDATEDIKNALDSKIRFFKIPRSFSIPPAMDIVGGEWLLCNPESVPNYSAVSYYFSKNIRQQYDVPIGIINASKGGSVIKMWMSSNSLNINNLEEIINAKIKDYIYLLSKDYGTINMTSNITDTAQFYAFDANDKTWAEVQFPMQWGTVNFMKMLGKIWYRKSFYLEEIPSSEVPFSLSLGQVDDADVTYLNGIKVGATRQVYEPARVYEIQNSILKKGRNVIAIQIENLGDFGGIHGNVNDLFYRIGREKYSLAGDWKIKPELVKFNHDWLFEQGEIPSVLFNAMIAPLAHFPFKAVLWYQGESDAIDNLEALHNYRFLFENLIQSWRTLFSKPDLPFIFAQLSNAYGGCPKPQESLWARLRESQSYVLHLPSTAQIINIDSGQHDNSLHPQNKPTVGKRFSLAARKLVYGENIIADGPTFERMERNGKYLHLYFLNVGKGLLLKDGDEVNNIAIAGNDKTFLWAKSRVEANKMILWNDEILEPVAVRYAWCDNPFEVNLYNSEGLPAAPFRTDEW